MVASGSGHGWPICGSPSDAQGEVDDAHRRWWTHLQSEGGSSAFTGPSTRSSTPVGLWGRLRSELAKRSIHALALQTAPPSLSTPPIPLITHIRPPWIAPVEQRDQRLWVGSSTGRVSEGHEAGMPQCGFLQQSCSDPQCSERCRVRKLSTFYLILRSPGHQGEFSDWPTIPPGLTSIASSWVDQTSSIEDVTTPGELRKPSPWPCFLSSRFRFARS